MNAWFTIHRMKEVSLAVFASSLYGFLYIQRNYADEQLAANHYRLWFVCGVLLIVVIVALVYACKMGMIEDREKDLQRIHVRIIGASSVPSVWQRLTSKFRKGNK